MVRINQEIPDDLHKVLKHEAVERGVSQKELIVSLLREALEEEENDNA